MLSLLCFLPPHPYKSCFLGYIFSVFRLFENLLQSSAYHSWKISGGLTFTSTLFDVQLFVQKGTTVLDKSSRTSQEESGRVLRHLPLLSAFLLQMLIILFLGINIIKGHFCSSFKKKVLRKSFKLILALFPNPVFRFVLQFLTALTKSSQTFEETGISCYFIKVYKLSAWFLMYPLLFWFSDFINSISEDVPFIG